MAELGEALKIILTKVGDFFDIFDLSFFVAGTLAFLGCLVTAHRLNLTIPTGETWPKVLLVLVLIYVSGLLCFTLGRWIRHRYNSLIGKGHQSANLEQGFLPVLRAHGLDRDPRFSGYLQRHDDQGPWRVYTRMWAELREDGARTASMALLRRYWVMSATCDGVAAALLGWSGIALWTSLQQWDAGDWGTPLAGAALLVALAALMLREANRYEDYQHEELAASLASSGSGGMPRAHDGH